MNTPMTDWITVTRPWSSELELIEGPTTQYREAAEGVVFILPVEGQVTLRAQEEVYRLCAEEVLLLIRGTAYHVEVTPSSTLLVGVIGGSRCPMTSLWSGEPDIVHLGTEAVSQVSALSPLSALIVSELRSPGAGVESMQAGLLDALLVAILRAAMRSRQSSSWLRGLDDPIAAPALEAVHKAPAEAWTLERLARVSSVSRSLFSQRFSECVGESPMAYVRRWRMSMAARLLVSERQRSLESIAADVGYTSQFAFSRAFKQTLGQSPGQFRRQRAPSRGAPPQAKPA